MWEKSGFSNITHINVVILPPLRVLSCIETLVGHVMFLKGLIDATCESFEPLHLQNQSPLWGGEGAKEDAFGWGADLVVAPPTYTYSD